MYCSEAAGAAGVTPATGEAPRGLGAGGDQGGQQEGEGGAEAVQDEQARREGQRAGVAGWLRLPFWRCCGYMAVGKFARYVTMTVLLLWVWPHSVHP